MKKRDVFLFAFILLSFFLHGQDNLLICDKYISKENDISTLILQKSVANLSVDFVDINLEKIKFFNEFILQFGGKQFIVTKHKVQERGINNFSFIGKNRNDGSSLTLSVLNDDIQGVIETNDGVYSIETIEKGNYAIVKLDHSKLVEACDQIKNDSNNIEDSSTSEHVNGNLIRIDSPTLFSTMEYNCKVRVLVLYTPGAQASVSNINNTVLLAIAETNQSFANSDINYEVELAYCGLTNYTESGDYTNDLYRFRNSSDSYMNEVHELRDQYSADICVLLINDVTYCGLAYGINVIERNAFCAVTAYNCATGYYSFGHEIGHLLGCRHDTFVDSSVTPFRYGHGYVSPTNNWRTIMAYGNACSGCTRIQYWSNPNILFGGISTGTTGLNNNARVWNEQSNNVMTFRQPANSITFTNSYIPNNTAIADIIVKNNIITSGNINITNGKILNMRAGNSITLQSGFSVELGAEYSVLIEGISDCGN